MKTELTVSIVIPNWNGGHLLKKNLPAVLAAALDSQIIVADDASTDNSLSLIQENFPEVVIVSGKKQRGFASNVNAGVERATGDIVVLLNTDVRPEKDFLKYIVTRFSDPDVAAVGCLEKSHEAGGIVLRGRGIARWEKGYFIHKKGDVDKEDTAWVSGGSAAYRRSVWNKLGGLDSIYNPFYWEDIDFSYQILKAGYRVVFENKSVVGHFHEEGKIKTSFTPRDVKKIVYRNQFIFLWKNMSDAYLWILHCFWTPIRLFQAVIKGDWLMLQGYMMALVKLPEVVKSRMRASSYWRLRDMTIFPS
jgi:GT2 family glycosyltransferase